MKKTLIFDELLTGHHLEYIHHLYMGAISKRDEDFVFILNPDFQIVSNKWHWPSCSNIEIKYLTISEKNRIEKSRFLKPLLLCKVLNKYVKAYNVTNIFLISLMGFMPFIPFLLKKKVEISGIIYLIYLYRWKRSTSVLRLLDMFKYFIFSNWKSFGKIYLLNDEYAPIYLNRLYNTTVFNYLPDPFIPFLDGNIKNVRHELNISSDKIVCLHFGALTERKGTLDLMEAIILSDKDSIRKCSFIFAGQIFNDIKDRFYKLLEEAENKTQVIVYDKFCDYEFISSLCISSDFIFIPYKNVEQSSGVIGYASQFNVPVIGPNSGLLGKLIRNYKLGYLLKDTSADNLSGFINDLDILTFDVSKSYVNEKTVSNFIKTIFEY